MASIQPRQRLDPQLFLVRYSCDAELEPGAQSGLVEAIRLAARLGPTALHFVLAGSIGYARPEIPKFWSRVAADRSTGLAAIAVTSSSTLIRIGTNAFRLATTVAHLPVAVAAFPAEAGGTTWCRQVLAEPLPKVA